MINQTSKKEQTLDAKEDPMRYQYDDFRGTQRAAPEAVVLALKTHCHVLSEST